MPKHRGRDRGHKQVTIFIRPYHVREEDKVVIDNKMKRLCYMGILEEGFLAYSAQ